MRIFPWACAILCACAGASSREPVSCDAPAERAEVEQIQVGWNAVESGRVDQPPVVDVSRPVRYERQAGDLANQLLVKCRQGAALGPLQDQYSEQPRGTVVIGSNSDLPFRRVALCLKPSECAVVRSNYAYHVVKRVR